MIELRDISVGYESSLISAVNLKSEKGKIIGLTGINGTGKSTLIRTISGDLKPLSGQILIDSKNVHKCSHRELSHLLAVSYTRYNVYGNSTFYDIVSLGRIPYSNQMGILKENDKQLIGQVMTTIGIDHLRDKPFRNGSDGERQKCLLARCLAQQTPIILLDEPTAFLDHPSKTNLFRILKDYCHQQTKTVIISSHDLELLEQYCDDLWHIDSDRIITRSSDEFNDVWKVFRYDKVM